MTNENLTGRAAEQNDIAGGPVPRDPRYAGFVGQGRRGRMGWVPDATGNRGERRAAAAQARRRERRR